MTVQHQILIAMKYWQSHWYCYWKIDQIHWERQMHPLRKTSLAEKNLAQSYWMHLHKHFATYHWSIITSLKGFEHTQVLRFQISLRTCIFWNGCLADHIAHILAVKHLVQMQTRPKVWWRQANLFADRKEVQIKYTGHQWLGPVHKGNIADCTRN